MVSTEKPKAGDGERDGRWKGSSKSECEKNKNKNYTNLLNMASGAAAGKAHRNLTVRTKTLAVLKKFL